ncbi:MAG: IS4 family transposase [Nanoarchaeota archaeon]|nr:IS4 family transposase [Nanoarchaeota archaeon]
MTQNTKYFELVKEDWSSINFGDKRLNERAITIGGKFLQNPFVSPPKMMKSLKDIKAFYRFMDSDKVSHEKLITSHVSNSRHKLLDSKITLAIQDTTTISLDRNYEIEGLYQVGGKNNCKAEGILAHNTISVTPYEKYGVVEGLIHQIIHERLPKNERTKENNDNSLWIKSIEAIGLAPVNTTIIDVMDRGGDILDIMNSSRKYNHEFIIRAKHNRFLNKELGNLFNFAKTLQVKGQRLLDVQGNKGRKRRIAKLNISSAKIVLPKTSTDNNSVNCSIVRVFEVDCPDNQEPLEWFILTSLEVENFDDALKITKYYSYRWIIEEYHKCMKTGFRLEKTQLKSLKRIENLIGFIAVSSIRLLQLRDIVRHNPETDAKDYVEKEDINIIRAYYKVEKREMTIDRFLRYIAQMGGFLNRKSDGNPGWESIWEGWKFFLGMKEGIQLYKRGLTCG